jgi:hypothetical protein
MTYSAGLWDLIQPPNNPALDALAKVRREVFDSIERLTQDEAKKEQELADIRRSLIGKQAQLADLDRSILTFRTDPTPMK